MTTNPTIDVRQDEGIDIAKIDPVLKANIDGLSGTPKLRQYASGASNLTYALDYPDRRLVLRRPPFGTKPKSGHDMSREYTVMKHLKPVYPWVPDVLYYSDDPDLIGSEFYVMERVDGYLVHTKIPKAWGWGTAQTRKMCYDFFDKLIALHQVDYNAAGLGDFGKPQGYVERQILGWNNRYERVLTPDGDDFADVRQWLETHRPQKEVGAAVLHGDFRIDNAILETEDPTQIRAILDWEISALGDPLMDLGNTLSFWIEADDPPEMQTLARQPSMAPGMLTRREILEYYTQKTGTDTSDFNFYYVYGLFRLAVILQQIYFRYYKGQTRDERFQSYGQMALLLGNAARDNIRHNQFT